MTEDEIVEIVSGEIDRAGFGGMIAKRACNRIVRRLMDLQAERSQSWWRRRWEEWKRWQR